MNRKTLIAAAAGCALVALAGIAWHFLADRAPPPDERKVLYWTDPMVPGYRSDKPGKSPFMDMELVPVYENSSTDGGPPTVAVSPEVAQKIGVRTAAVTRAAAQRTLAATGYLFRGNGAWVAIVDLFERDTSWLRPGLTADVRITDLPGARFAARVERIESDRDIGGRSMKARVRLLQSDPRLQANMAADVVVNAPAAGRLLLVPREALIRTARRSTLIRVLDDGRFQPVEVVAGEEFGEQVEIKSGVREGDRIVVSSQFLIDSEASVRESLKRMESESGPATGQHQH
jgi:Cu(I)/Ag(I) efflux system membrane fusion protein